MVAMVAMGHLGVVAIPLATAPAGVPQAGGHRGGAPLGHALGALEGAAEDLVHHLVSPLTGISRRKEGGGGQIGTYKNRGGQEFSET